MTAPLGLPFDPIDRARDLWRRRWGGGAPADEMAAATSVLRAAQLLTNRFDAVCAEHGLTFARYEALVLLAFSRGGELPMRRVGERLMVHPTSATSIVARLERQGFVQRLPNPDDGRGVLARITPEGIRAMEGATADLHTIGFGMDALDDPGRAQLFGLLRAMRVRAGDFDDGSHERGSDAGGDER